MRHSSVWFHFGLTWIFRLKELGECFNSSVASECTKMSVMRRLDCSHKICLPPRRRLKVTWQLKALAWFKSSKESRCYQS